MVFWANTSLGIGLALLGSLLSATGLVLQKHSHNIGESDFALWHRWRWWLGFVLLVIVGGCTDAVALMIAPLSVIAPLCGATLVFNALLAAHFLGEPLSPQDKCSIGIVVVGVTLTSVFGSHDAPNYDSHTLVSMLLKPYTILYFIASGVVICAFCVIAMWPGRSLRLEAFAFASMAGCLGGLQNLFLKCTSELVKESFRQDGSNQWDAVTPYVLLVFTAGLATAQLVTLNLGLARHPAVLYLPMYQAMLELCGVIAGGVFFEEFARFSTLAWICFPLGAVVVFYGLFNLTTRATGDPISIMPHLEDDVEECLLSEHDASLLDHHDHALEQHDGGLFDGVDDI